MMLDRVGAESARATSLVRYAPNSHFPCHQHIGGEEILVLEGEFGDEHGRYPAGSYLRNPIGTEHSPQVGPQGATIFVKLQQFDPDDQRQCVIDTTTQSWLPGLVEGVEVMPLHEFRGSRHQEQVSLVRWQPETEFERHDHPGGEEILVLDGELFDEHGHYPAGSWLRNPSDSQHRPCSGDKGALLWVKTGHLRSMHPG